MSFNNVRFSASGLNYRVGYLARHITVPYGETSLCCG